MSICAHATTIARCVLGVHIWWSIEGKCQQVVYWRSVYARLASELEAKGNMVDARQVRLQVHDLDTLITEMDITQQSIEDGKRKPIFLLLPSAPFQEVIVDAQA
jgi:hypothetical protein